MTILGIDPVTLAVGLFCGAWGTIAYYWWKEARR